MPTSDGRILFEDLNPEQKLILDHATSGFDNLLYNSFRASINVRGLVKAIKGFGTHINERLRKKIQKEIVDPILTRHGINEEGLDSLLTKKQTPEEDLELEKEREKVLEVVRRFTRQAFTGDPLMFRSPEKRVQINVDLIESGVTQGEHRKKPSIFQSLTGKKESTENKLNDAFETFGKVLLLFPGVVSVQKGKNRLYIGVEDKKYLDDIKRRVKETRALAGVPVEIITEDSKNASSQVPGQTSYNPQHNFLDLYGIGTDKKFR